MEKSYVINRIKELCNKKNDREIALDFFYNNRIFRVSGFSWLVSFLLSV